MTKLYERCPTCDGAGRRWMGHAHKFVGCDGCQGSGFAPADVAMDRAGIERLRVERDEARRERDALEGMPIAPALGGYVARIPWRKGGYPHGEYLNSGGYWFGSWDLARKAVRLAAGLDGEG